MFIFDSKIRAELDFFGYLKVQPAIFAYYLFITNHQLLNINIQEVEDCLKEFQSLLQSLENDPLNYSLLGYAYKTLEKFEEATAAFEKAADLYQPIEDSSEYTLAVENQALCLSMLLPKEIERTSSTIGSDLDNQNDHSANSDTSIYFIKPVYNNPFLNHPEILREVYNLAGIKGINLFLELSADQNIAEQLLHEIKDQGIEEVLSVLFTKQSKVKIQEVEVQENIDDSILSRIEKIEQLIGEKESKELVGFSQYVLNSLSHNQFSASAKQVIKVVSNLAQNFEELLDISLYIEDEHVISYDSYVTALWMQLACFFEYLESGQRFNGFIPRPPYFDSDPDGGFGGGCSGGNGDEDGDNKWCSDYIQLPFLAYNNVSFMLVGNNGTNSVSDSDYA